MIYIRAAYYSGIALSKSDSSLYLRLMPDCISHPAIVRIRMSKDGMAPWQVAFIIVGFRGLLLVPALLMLSEPARRGPGGEVHLSIREVVDVVRQRRAALLPIFAGFALVILVANALAFRTPAAITKNPSAGFWTGLS